ncbi:hypothetical protein LJC64_02820 [Ruminococcaceae bacterium OttesenSCG-928-A11]|nr:hypothetical protein [Ruminococcaceae bacterium OttesenSCG-928-A11]
MGILSCIKQGLTGLRRKRFKRQHARARKRLAELELSIVTAMCRHLAQNGGFEIKGPAEQHARQIIGNDALMGALLDAHHALPDGQVPHNS